MTRYNLDELVPSLLLGGICVLLYVYYYLALGLIWIWHWMLH
ncbi:hypothetical protein [Hymenobacter sp. YC55]|nr:hypothetical protein [Hymenobacter sp. YC55]MDF7813982.1 hypothetical protein [Hymenobacter sp. YC55]